MSLSTFTVLMVEDLVTDRELYRRALCQDSSCVYELLEAESLAAGLALCQTRSIDAVLLDFQLPDGNGLDFLSELSVQSNGRMPPVVMMTGQDNESTAVRAIKLGAEDYVVKSDLTPDLLQLKVRRAILQGRGYANESSRRRQQQQQVELSLQAANQQITMIWESMTDAYTTLDRDWRLVYANPAATEIYRQMLGSATAEFLGRTYWEVFPWSVGTIVEQEYRRAVTDRVAVHFELFYQPSETWFEVHAYPSDVGLGIYFQDINQRQRAELARLAAEQERDRFFNLSLDLLVVATFEGNFVRVNPACERILGFTSTELIGQNYLEFVHPEDRAATVAIVADLNAGNVLTNFEDRYRCKDGSYRWLSWSVMPDIDRQLLYVNAHDITERKRSEAARLAAEQERDRFFDRSIDLLAIGNFEGYFERINPAFERLLGFSETEFISRPFIDFVHPDDRASTLAAAQGLADGQSVVDFENRCRCNDGSYVWVSWNATPYQQSNCWYGVGRDISLRKQTEIALQIGEELFRSTFENTSIGLAHVALDGTWMRVNQKLCEILGYDSAELLATTFQAITESADLAEDLDLVRQLVNGEINEYTLEKRYIHKQGHHVWANLTVTLIRTIATDGRLGIPQYFISAIQDITDRKQLEAQLRQRESQLQLFVKYVPVGLAMFDRQMCYLSASDVWLDCHELRDREIVGRSHYDLYPNLPQEWKEMHQRCLAGAIESCEEDLFPRPDGSIDWVRWEARPWYTDTDEVGGIIMFSEIITDLKLRSAALLQSERKFSAIFNQTFQLMGLVSLDGVLLEVNQAALDSIAAPESEIIGKSFWDAPWWHTEQLQQQLRDAIATAASGRFVRYEVEFPNPSGGVTITDFSLKPMFDEVGQVESIVAEAHDITDRKQAQADLEQRNQELDSFVYVVSHDLKAPLRGIANLSQWIEEDFDGSLSVTNQQQMTLLRSRVYKMEATIDGLLEYARLGIADVGIVESVSIAELLADVIDSIAPPPTFTIVLPPELPMLSTRRLPLFQVFANLIGNGIKHHHSETGSIQISVEEQGDFYEFAIADDGPGIDPEHHDRMFKIFQAVNPQKRSDSTGIGLAIVKKIVEAEGGTIWLESELGKGTTFYFTWPKR